VQVAPINPTLKPPGTKRLKLNCGYTGFNFCFQIQLAPLQHGADTDHVCAPLDAGRHGRAVQVDPIKLTLKVPGTKRLKLKCDGPLSNFAFKFNLRRCSTVEENVHALSERRRAAAPGEAGDVGRARGGAGTGLLISEVELLIPRP